jgi:hypothetical protein
MTTTIEAMFDGEVLRPATPLPLRPNTRVTLTVEAPEAATATESFLDTALSMRLEGPPDWSENVDKYLAEVRRPADD